MDKIQSLQTEEDIVQVTDSKPAAPSTVPVTSRQIDVLFGAYADVLFILLPYAAVTVFRLWQSDVATVLRDNDLAIASSVLAGLAIVKFILGMVVHPDMVQHREKLVFLVAGTSIGVLIPGVLMSVAILWFEQVPDFVMLAQPMLLILSIMCYTGSVATTNALLEKRSNASQPQT